eukprot:gene3736-11498_t
MSDGGLCAVRLLPRPADGCPHLLARPADQGPARRRVPDRESAAAADGAPRLSAADGRRVPVRRGPRRCAGCPDSPTAAGAGAAACMTCYGDNSSACIATDGSADCRECWRPPPTKAPLAAGSPTESPRRPPTAPPASSQPTAGGAPTSAPATYSPTVSIPAKCALVVDGGKWLVSGLACICPGDEVITTAGGIDIAAQCCESDGTCRRHNGSADDAGC